MQICITFCCSSQDMPSNQLLLILYQNAIMIPKPKGPHPHLEILDDWKQVVVVSGEATCTETQQTFTAPCIVPNRVRYFCDSCLVCVL